MLSVEGFAQTTWQSTIVKFGTDGRLIYAADSAQNRIVDFSCAGYKNSNEPIPNITNIITILTAIPGDNTAAINNAIKAAASVQPDGNGFKGVILLKRGKYEIQGTISLNVSGVVLRGEGSDTSGTVLVATGNTPSQRTVFVAGGGTSAQWKKYGSVQTNITTPFVAVGSTQFTVADASQFVVGDPIVVYHPSTVAWLTAVDNGGVAGAAPWNPGSIDIQYNRTIIAINGNDITIDSPVMNHLNLALAQSYIYKIDKSSTKYKIGVENLRIGIQNWTNMYLDENHAWEGLVMADIEDSWTKNVVALHFGQSGFQTFTATRVTIDSCQALDPVAQLLGSQRDNFQIDEWSSNILITRCYATNARHSFEVSGTSKASGIVFHRCTAVDGTNPSEGHFHWSTGLLYDCFRDYGTDPNPGTVLGLYNRGDMGTNHGWSAAHSVAWNCDLRRATGAGGELDCQNPPTAKNYVIGGFGQVNTKPPFPQYGVGYVEGFNNYNAVLTPESLFEEQLKERLSQGRVLKLGQMIYFAALPAKNVGDPDFAPGAYSSSGLTVTYSSSNSAVAIIVNNQIHIVGAGTATIIASQSGNAGYFAATSISQMLTVAGSNSVSITLNPVADAYVWGSNINTNYGTDTTLNVKSADNTANNRSSYLKFNLAGQGIFSVTSAKVRLYANSVSSAFSITAFQTADSWTETGITYLNCPAAGSAISAVSVSALGAYYVWDVTSYVQNKLSFGDSLMSLLFNDSYFADSLHRANQMIKFNSREATSNKPELVIVSPGKPTSIDESDQTVQIRETRLVSNYPNPFNPSTTLRYEIAKDALVQIVVYDVRGAKVQEVMNNRKVAGVYEVRLNAASLASGMYFVRFIAVPINGAGNIINTRKISLVK